MNSWHLDAWGWAIIALGAVLTGLSKTGIPGLGVLAVALYANVFPAATSTGILLPLLICADVVAVAAYRRHAVWGHLWRLFPWVAAGVVAGYAIMGWLKDAEMKRLIGIIVLAMTGLHCWRQYRRTETEALPPGRWFAATMGLLAGFTTMVANAAGPVMILYLLAMGLPKMEFLGTGAWFFFLLNVAKIPFSAKRGLITTESLALDAVVAPLVIVSAWVGRYVAHRVNEKVFIALALVFTVLAGLRLVW